MAKTWVLDTDTKGTGARMVPLEDVLEKPEPKPRRKHPASTDKSVRPAPRSAREPEHKQLAPLPPGHVRKKATGEIGRVRSVDAKAGTASVLWLKQGRTSTVPLSAISRR
jgi:hypothetical protein